MTDVEICSQTGSNSPEETDAGPPNKKMKQMDLRQFKQARLPFIPLDQKPLQAAGNTPPGSKKRKLSDGESPSAKPSKTQKSIAIEKPAIVENDPEVSSSSEAENIPLQNLKSRVRNTLERFVRRNSQDEITSTKDEISSTIECVDLTDSNDGIVEVAKSSTDQEESTTTEASVGDSAEAIKEENKENKPGHDGKSKKTKGSIKKEKKESDEEENEGDNATSTSMEVDEVSSDDKAEEKRGSEAKEKKVSKSNKKKKGNLEESKVTEESLDVDRKRNVSEASTTSADGEFTTPAKGKPSDSLIMTPASEAETPGSSQSPDNSCSDSTPKSSKKKTPKRLSDANLKERELMRQRIKEQKDKEREEKKKKKEEERLAKEAEKEKQRKQREEAKAEKERQKREAQEKKEKERQEKMQQKEEEKRKKLEIIEAKQEEKRKKEEEKKQKEEEKRKEEEEKKLKEQKKKESFTSFFIKPKTSPTSKPNKAASGPFMPFELMKDMHLAPQSRRKKLDEDEKDKLDSLLTAQNEKTLYLQQLKNKEVSPHKMGKTLKKKEEDDVMLVHDSETVKKVTFHCKLLQFHMNYRPPYYGTWRKKSRVLTPRNPFKTDNDLFDYEVDSDDEWEEEEPGESLSASEDEEEKEDNSDDEEEDGWMVPHGYLSEGEGCEDDEEVTPEMLKARQKAKADQWESELKRQTQPVLPIIIGCFWEHAVHNLQKEVEEKLKDYTGVSLMGEQIQTTFSGAKSNKKADSSNGEKEEKSNPQCKPVPEEAMPDLIRLVHGNLAGIKKLIKEFRMFWKIKTGKADLENPADVSMEEDEGVKPEENKADIEMTEQKVTGKSPNNFAISKRQLELKISAIAVREKREPYKKICWYVHDPILKQYQMEDLPVPSTWEFISQPAKTPNKPKTEETPNSGRKTPTVSITQFARPMSPSARQAQFAAANAAALAEKQKVLEEQAKLQAPQNRTTEEVVPMDVTASSSKNDQMSIKEFTKNITPAKHHEWKMVSAGNSPREGKRLILVSQGSPKTGSENSPKASSIQPKPSTTTTPAKSSRQNLPASNFMSPVPSPSTAIKADNLMLSPSVGVKPLQQSPKSHPSPQTSSGAKKRIVPIPVVDGKPISDLKPAVIKPRVISLISSSQSESMEVEVSGTGENSQDAIVLE